MEDRESVRTDNPPSALSHSQSIGLPAVEALGVKQRDAGGGRTQVEVELALEAMRAQASRYWRLALKAHYADGAAIWEIVSQNGPLARNPALSLPALSTRDGRSPIVGFQAEMTVNFARSVSIVKYAEFAMPRPDEGLHSRVTEPFESRPHIVILDARPVGDVSLTRRCIEVIWKACAPAPAVIHRFHIRLNVAHADGFIRRVRNTVEAKRRRAFIGVAPHSAAIASLSVGLSATVTWFGSATDAGIEAF